MAWSADDEYRTRVLARRRAVVQLRHPAAVFGPSALVLMYATGLVAAITMARGFAHLDDVAASVLVLPAGAAAVMSALAVGFRLLRYQEPSAGAIIMRVGLIWALFGAAWPVLGIAANVAAHPAGGIQHLTSVFDAVMMRALAGACVGGVGGILGGAAATLLCVERSR